MAMDRPTKKWWIIGIMFACRRIIPRTIFVGFGYCRRMKSPAFTMASLTRLWPRATMRMCGLRSGLLTGSNMSRSTNGSQRPWSKRPRPMILRHPWCRIILHYCPRWYGRVAERDHHHVLAYSLAQLRKLCILVRGGGILEGLLGSSIVGFHTREQTISVLSSMHFEGASTAAHRPSHYGGAG